jgi:hypothetical protein
VQDDRFEIDFGRELILGTDWKEAVGKALTSKYHLENENIHEVSPGN